MIGHLDFSVGSAGFQASVIADVAATPSRGLVVLATGLGREGAEKCLARSPAR